MIVGIGVDCIDKRNDILNNKTFIKQTFSKPEQEEAQNHYDKNLYFAERFAVKEAVFKAINDIEKEYDDLRLVQTLCKKNGKPITTFLIPKFQSIYKIHTSITNENDCVTAFVIVEK